MRRIEVLDGVAPRHDKYDVWFGIGFVVGSLGLVTLSIFYWRFNASHALALIATGSLLAAIYQLRHSSEPTLPPVRPDFDGTEDEKLLDFGLKNFGSEPALYIQVVAEIDGEDVVKLRPRQRPVHLDEDEFLGLVHDDRLPERIEDNNDFKGILDKAEVELYYSFVSTGGARAPQDMNLDDFGDDECVFEEITGEDQDPRTMEIRRIKEYCI